jgi:hypothetical protein
LVVSIFQLSGAGSRDLMTWTMARATSPYRRGDTRCSSGTCWGEREHDLAKKSGMVMLDSDNKVSFEEMAAILDRIGVAAIIYTSARNRPEEPRLRLMG